MENLRPNQQRARNAIALIWIVLALEMVSLISGYFQYDLLRTVANGGEVSAEFAAANDIRERIVGILCSIAYVCSAVTFIQWFRRAYFNLHQKITYLSYTEGWAAGCWFVPILNLYRPYQIMKELYQETRELLVKKGISISRDFTTDTLGWWWALWIIGGVIGRMVFRLAARAESIDEFIIYTIASMISNILTIPLALISIKVIKDYSNVEPLLAMPWTYSESEESGVAQK